MSRGLGDVYKRQIYIYIYIYINVDIDVDIDISVGITRNIDVGIDEDTDRDIGIDVDVDIDTDIDRYMCHIRMKCPYLRRNGRENGSVAHSSCENIGLSSLRLVSARRCGPFIRTSHGN